MARSRASGAWGRILPAVVLGLLSLGPPAFAAPQPFRIVSAEEAPTNYTRDGRFTGITTDIVEAMLAEAGLEAVIEVYPWARAYDIALKEPNVLIFTAGRTQERVDLGFGFIGPVTTRKHTLYKKAGSPLAITSLEDLRRQGLLVGAMRGDWREKHLRDKGVAVKDVTSHGQSLKMLQEGRIDLVALSDLELAENLLISGVDRRALEPAFVFQELDAYILVSKGSSPESYAKLRAAFAALRDRGFLETTAGKWSGLLGLPLGYDAAKGIHYLPEPAR
ncbi:MAG: transporter substrate-binding domain-containing protein [Spirochaetaceae bacterium]|nr:transporter substrate-binding domain-containing protein [Spirochaetaceae bacterium]